MNKTKVERNFLKTHYSMFHMSLKIKLGHLNNLHSLLATYDMNQHKSHPQNNKQALLGTSLEKEPGIHA